jgi:hypothetical protein
VQNGTFFDNTDIMPIFGYQPDGELTDKNTRKKHGLPEKSRRPALNRLDTLHRMDAYIGLNSDWVNVETVIRTAPDQIAIGPGSLVREWDGGRPPLFSLQTRPRVVQFLLLPQRPLRGGPPRLERRQTGGVPPPRPRFQRAAYADGDGKIAGVFHQKLRPVLPQAVPDHRVSALFQFCAVVSRHDALLRKRGFYSGF